ncbi:TetR/AcrR family transcriptional regulator [Nonomuraea aurantiaca]|jgi:AcrR family transcriptional regulator|uniref:TetR/AcrR family transcriptional regulator n=1 Tax=Nonomuraea aurantiaca TaxID=2878562 RepID=UPI001CD92004|nr:TetR/AcrR family transcriptional regulator [Nonomuraea aurantiaca]MCA2219610.1 TetR/AcrR family transcriptional regulator [Nonomuraea aurantiaca]
MQTSGTRREATEARKAQIASATIAVLAERGYAETTFEAICEHAGLSSKRLISYHFSSKEQLFEAVVGQVIADAAVFMRPALQAASGAEAQLEAFIRANIAFIAAHPAHVRAVQQIAYNQAFAGEHERDAAIARLVALFTDGQRTGAFRAFDSVLMSTALRASIDAMADRIVGGLDPDHCASELVEIFGRATRAEF